MWARRRSENWPPKIANADCQLYECKYKLLWNLGKNYVFVLQDTGCSPAPEGYAPQIEWQQARVVEFSALRKQISDQMMYLDKKGRKPVSSKALVNKVAISHVQYGPSVEIIKLHLQILLE